MTQNFSFQTINYQVQFRNPNLPENTMLTVKLGGGKIMQLEHISPGRKGKLGRVDRMMDAKQKESHRG